MTTGSLGPFTAGWAPLYVVETTTSQIGVYRLEARKTTGKSGRSTFELLQMLTYDPRAAANKEDPRGARTSQRSGRDRKEILATGPVLVRYDQTTKASIRSMRSTSSTMCRRMRAALPTFRQPAQSTTIIESFVDRDLAADFKVDFIVADVPLLMTTGSLGPGRPVGSALRHRDHEQPARRLPPHPADGSRRPVNELCNAAVSPSAAASVGQRASLEREPRAVAPGRDSPWTSTAPARTAAHRRGPLPGFGGFFTTAENRSRSVWPGIIVIEQPLRPWIEDLHPTSLAIRAVWVAVAATHARKDGTGLVLEEAKPHVVETQAKRRFAFVINRVEDLLVNGRGMERENDHSDGHRPAGQREDDATGVIDRQRKPHHRRRDGLGSHP